MPYLHLDLPLGVPATGRARIAGRLARLYAEVMETEPGRVTVAFASWARTASSASARTARSSPS